ncbi:MAG: hypothetical protein AB7O44_26785 [Hyphomicrobiaceae bacterium]
MAAISATGMTMKMAAASDTGVTAGNECDGCASSDKGCGMTAMDCAATMCAPMTAMEPQAEPAAALDLQAPPSPNRPVLIGWPSSPDPRPPRARDFT